MVIVLIDQILTLSKWKSSHHIERSFLQESWKQEIFEEIKSLELKKKDFLLRTDGREPKLLEEVLADPQSVKQIVTSNANNIRNPLQNTRLHAECAFQ